jgi:hypothetical protein
LVHVFAETIPASDRNPTGAIPLTRICGANALKVTTPWRTGGVSTTSFATEIAELPSKVNPTGKLTLGLVAPPITWKFKLFSVFASAVKLPPNVAAPTSVRFDVGAINPAAAVVRVPPCTSISPFTTRGGHAIFATAPEPPPPVRENVG